MRNLEFYIVKDDDIQLSNNLSQNEIIFILDGKSGYIWKGTKARNLDEITVKKVEELILNKFKNINFGLITDLYVSESDNPKMTQIKNEIINRLPKTISKIKEKPVSLIKKFKNNISENYSLIPIKN